MIDVTHEADDGAVVALSLASNPREAVYVRFVRPAPCVARERGYRDAAPFDRDGLIRAALADIGRELRRPSEWAETVALTHAAPSPGAVLQGGDLALLLLAALSETTGVSLGEVV